MSWESIKESQRAVRVAGLEPGQVSLLHFVFWRICAYVVLAGLGPPHGPHPEYLSPSQHVSHTWDHTWDSSLAQPEKRLDSGGLRAVRFSQLP